MYIFMQYIILYYLLNCIIILYNLKRKVNGVFYALRRILKRSLCEKLHELGCDGVPL